MRGYVLIHQYNPDYDDRRGGFESYSEEFYVSAERAQMICDRRNANNLARMNESAEKEHNATMDKWEKEVREHNALVRAGLREPNDTKVFERTTFTPYTFGDKLHASYWDGYRTVSVGKWVVEPIEFEDWEENDG